MGLSPSEPQTGGYWRGNDQLGYFTSHDRGCIVSLSDSLQLVDGSLVMQHAENDCRAKGFRTGSPDLALCVLQTAQSHPEPTPAQASVAAATPSAISAGHRPDRGKKRAHPRSTSAVRSRARAHRSGAISRWELTLLEVIHHALSRKSGVER
jgi:hypothetical protein